MSILRGLPSCICKCILFLAAWDIVKLQSGQTVFFSSYLLKNQLNATSSVHRTSVKVPPFLSILALSQPLGDIIFVCFQVMG